MDKRENEYVLWFDELRRADVGLVGGKFFFPWGTDQCNQGAGTIWICYNR